MRFVSTTRAVDAKVGFIGLGNMGAHMARNLVAAGHQVTVFDLVPEAVASVTEKGAAASDTAAGVAEDAEVVITMLPSSPHVQNVYMGEGNVIATAPKGALVIDCSTIDPGTARTVATSATEAGLRMVDAPVSGGVGGAEAGTLTFMVGGSSENFEAARPLLENMGANIVHCGDSGTGQVAKLCNNLILGISMAAVSEAMNVGVRLGIDPKTLAGIVNTSSGRCWSSDTYNPVPGVMEGVPSSRDYAGGFGSALMLKDLGLAADAAASVGAPLHTGKAAVDLFTAMVDSGLGGKDFSSAYKFVKDASTDKN